MTRGECPPKVAENSTTRSATPRMPTMLSASSLEKSATAMETLNAAPRLEGSVDGAGSRRATPLVVVLFWRKRKRAHRH